MYNHRYYCWENLYVVSEVYAPEDDIADVETCRDSNINLKLHQELAL
jgi:hypothetical protein